MYQEFKEWLRGNIDKNCNSNIAYEKCKEYIRSLHTNYEQYEDLIEIAVCWIDF